MRAGTYSINAHIVDATGAASNLQIKLVVSPRLAITSSRLPAGSSGHGYRARLTCGAASGRSPGARPGFRLG
jgi:hypothetical protein